MGFWGFDMVNGNEKHVLFFDDGDLVAAVQRVQDSVGIDHLDMPTIGDLSQVSFELDRSGINGELLCLHWLRNRIVRLHKKGMLVRLPDAADDYDYAADDLNYDAAREQGNIA